MACLGFRPPTTAQEASLGRPGALLERFRAGVGPSWEPLGRSLGPRRPTWGPLGSLLGRLEVILEASRRPLGPFWGPLEPSWGPLGSLLGRLGAVAGVFWTVFNAAKAEKMYILKMYVCQLEITVFCILGPSWGASWRPLGPSWRPLEPSWSVLGASWAVLTPSWAVRKPRMSAGEASGKVRGRSGEASGGRGTLVLFWCPWCAAAWGGPGPGFRYMREVHPARRMFVRRGRGCTVEISLALEQARK